MQSTRPLVVVDTNVWISGLLNKAGVPAQVSGWVIRHAMPVFTAATFAELGERIWRPKFDRYLTMERRKQVLADLSAIGHWVDLPTEIAARSFCRDATDDKFIHLAMAAHAALLITGDQDLLVLADGLLLDGVRVLSPAAALALPEFSLRTAGSETGR